MVDPAGFAAFLRTHLHNLLVHIPVGLIVAGSVFLWLPPKPVHTVAARVLWGLAAVFSLLAAYTGENQIFNLGPDTPRPVLDLHRALGTWTTFLVWGGFLSLWMSHGRPWKALTAAVLTGLVLATLILGTGVAHP